MGKWKKAIAYVLDVVLTDGVVRWLFIRALRKTVEWGRRLASRTQTEADDRILSELIKILDQLENPT